MDKQDVILVNEQDEVIGVMDKMLVHQKGLLHRAFSIFIFNSKGQMLLQQRSSNKYHGALLWTNACCSHPSPGEKTEDAAKRRLKQELGFETTLHKIFDFTYYAQVENNLVEHEFDHVFTGEYDGQVKINNHEVAACSFKGINNIKAMLEAEPLQFTSWFKIAFPEIEKWWMRKYK